MLRQEINYREDRPWGFFEVVYSDRDFTTKILTLNPHSRTSLQVHAQRQEIWSPLQPVDVFVAGEEKVVLPGEQEIVPAGTVHRLTNNTDEVIQIVEVMVGEYSEKDITRLEDDWNRV